MRSIDLTFLAAAVVLLYLPSVLKGGWLFDDPALTDIEWKFKEGRFRLNYGPALRADGSPYPVWLQFWNHPRALSMWTFQRTYDCFGFDVRAHRTVNLVLHLAAGALVYLIARERLTGGSLSTLAAGIFLLHPLQVSAVAYVSARPSILAAVFAFTGVYCWGTGFPWAALIAQFLAQKSKEDSWLYILSWPLALFWFGRISDITEVLYWGSASVLILILLLYRLFFRERRIASLNIGDTGR